MRDSSISLDIIRSQKVAILGYGNQGRAQALNLRDSGVQVTVGARSGVGHQLALKDGFHPVSFEQAIQSCQVIMYLFPDQVIPEIYRQTREHLNRQHTIGFAHGFCYHFKWIEPLQECHYFLVGSKGAGAVLRDAFERGSGLPGVYALSEENEPLENLVKSYAAAVGLTTHLLLKTTFQEETECDLFGEQSVLCGGLLELMESAFETLVSEGLTPEMAFLECCYEAKTIVELWIKNGPLGVTQKISPTAFYGGLSRGKRLIDDKTKQEMKAIFQEIRSGKFAQEWAQEVRDGEKSLHTERHRIANSLLQSTFCRMVDLGVR